MLKFLTYPREGINIILSHAVIPPPPILRWLGEEAINYCRCYALEAERKMGQLIRDNPDIKPGGDRKSLSRRVTMKLSDIGLTRRESAEAQILATLPEETFEAVKMGEKTRTQVRREQKRDEVIRRAKEFPPYLIP